MTGEYRIAKRGTLSGSRTISFTFDGKSYEGLKGDTLASFYNLKSIDPHDPIVSARSRVIAEEDGIVINRSPSSSVHQGMELYQVMTKLTEHRATK